MTVASIVLGGLTHVRESGRAPAPARIVGVLIAFLVVGDSAASSAAPAPTGQGESALFEQSIRPLLESKCLRCHDAKVHKADLDLSTHASILKGGESGEVVVPGKPEESPLYEMVRDGQMPKDKKNKLTPEQVESLRRWIEAGAPAGPTATAPVAVAATLTQHDVYPILLRRCVVCHGREVREGGLDLRTRASMLKGGKSGPAFMPSRPETSLMLEKIRTGAMPPRLRIVEVSVKPIEPAETEVVTRWIALGAPEAEIAPDVAGVEADPLVSDKDREFWSFRPPGPVSIPAVKHPEQAANPIDAFILARLEAKGLTLSPEADRLTLLRRAALDLTGLPPDPDEIDAFLSDRDPNAYERLVDRLLASPHYGERWGRHWLDVAGYADSEGKREQDLPRPFAWRYREYVVRSFNADKPYDRFLLEQIAGDELADYEHASEITQEIEDNLVATGFLRMAPDPSWAQITNFVADRLDIVADEIDVFGSGILGLTLKCARCHTHKFDPIPHRDYYRLVATFKGAFDEHDWLRSNWEPTISKGRRADRELPYVTLAERKRWETHNADLKREIESLKSKSDPKSKEAIASLQKQILREPTVRALWDRGEPSPTYIYRRGDYLSPGRLVGPGVPSVLTDGKTPFTVTPPWPGARSTGRRLALAHWLTRPDHPLTARVMVNRVWKHHFGAGLVATLGNFGKAGASPTHPELLDWLAVEFVARGWSLKAMHRLMLTSTTYRQSSSVSGLARRLDPDNALYSRRPLLRMEAEVLYDAMLRVAGRLDPTPFGAPDAVTVRPDGLITPSGSARGWRRSLYVRQDRKQVPTLLEVFDLPQMNPNCLERRDSNVAPQALHLWNDGLVRTLAEQFAQRVSSVAGDDPDRQVDQVFRIALGRPPDAAERDVTLEALARLKAEWSRHHAEGPKPGEPEPLLRPLSTICHAILNSASFLYID
jgi:hypothetical protein